MKTAEMEVTLVDVMGNDLSVVNAARVSFDKRSHPEAACWSCSWIGAYPGSDECPQCGEDNAGWERELELSDRDVKLIAYLAKHNHWTPFSHPQMTFRIKAPIFVARQWFKHMIGITRNETSRRYVDSEPEFWFPKEWRGRPDGSMKQGSSGVHPASGVWSAAAMLNVGALLNLYNEMIADGVAPEQARMILPQNMMTEWIETCSLAAAARACKLRLDPHAQAETREVAEKIDAIAKAHFPVSWAALMQ